MEPEWIAQVTTQEEENEWSPSPAQQKLHARPRHIPEHTKELLIAFIYLILICATFFAWLLLILGIFSLFMSETDHTRAIYVVGWSALFLGVILFVVWVRDQLRPKEGLHKEENNKGRSNTSTTSKSIQSQTPPKANIILVPPLNPRTVKTHEHSLDKKIEHSL